MKSLEEKKLLARMARNVGQPDLELEESIRREENLFNNLFKKESKTEEKPIAPTVLVEEKLFTPSANLVQSTAAHIKIAPSERVNESPDPISAELTRLRSQLADVMGKIGTMSWGGGGTGVVRFENLDDHQHPTDIRVLEFNTAGTSDPVIPVGSLTWNTEEDCLNVHQETTILQAGLENYIRVHNHTGVTMPQGTFVMFAGVDEPDAGHEDHSPTVIPYLANSAYPPLYTVGLLTEDIDHMANGRATTFGKVRFIDTTGSSVGETWQLGDLLWAHPTIPGALTRVQPTAPNLAVSVAVVLHVSVTEGVLLVRPSIFPRLHYGSFHSTQSQSAALANTAYAVTFNTTDIGCGHVHTAVGNSANIVCDHQGLYSFDFQLQVTSTNSSRSNIWIWARKNGIDIPYSATKLSIESNGGIISPSWSFRVSMLANDSFQLMWAVDTTNVSLTAPASTSFCPETPSATLHVSQVNL